MRTIERTKQLALLGAIIAALAACGAAHAKNLYSYDLDSLAYMSTDIVRATIVKSGEGFEVRVEQAYAGKAAKGDVLHFDLSLYRKPPKTDDPNTLPLVVGDELILFFNKTNGVSKTGDQWAVESGVKLIQGGKAYSAHQWDNPGPYVLDCRSENIKNAVSLKQLELDLNASIKSAAAFQKKLSAPPTPKDIPWLLEDLKQRSTVTGEWFSRDHIGELLSVRLANLHDYEAIDQAITVLSRTDERVWTLLAGYATPKGRDYMLKVIADAKQPMKKRILYAHGLWNIGVEYHQGSEAGIRSRTITGDIGEDNGDFLKRVAQLAVDNAADEPLCLAILRSLRSCADEVTQIKDKVLTADLTAALGVLGKQYRTSQSQKVKFAIELVTLRGDRDAYKKLESPCGDVPFLLSPPSTRYTPSKTPSLIFEYEYATETQDLSKLSYCIILERLGGPERFEIPWKVEMSANTHGISGGGSGAVDLPKDVPAGKYKVYLRMKSNDKTWVSYSFETQTPQGDIPRKDKE
jgi:hypothetical protein